MAEKIMYNDGGTAVPSAFRKPQGTSFSAVPSPKGATRWLMEPWTCEGRTFLCR